MQDNIFEPVNIPKKNFMGSVSVCPMCGEKGFKDYQEHLENAHLQDSCTKIINIFKTKVEELRLLSSKMYLIHFFYLKKENDMNSPATPKDRQRMLSYEQDIKDITSAIFSEKIL